MNFIRNLFNFGKHKEETGEHEKLHPPRPTPSGTRMTPPPPHSTPAHPQHSTPSHSTPSAAQSTSTSPQTSASKEKVVRKSRQREIKREEPKEAKKEEPAKKEEVLPTPKTITEETKTQCDEKKSEAAVPKRPTKAKAVNSEEALTDFETVAAPSRPAISRSASRNKKRFSQLTPNSPEGQKEATENEEKKERTEDTGATQEQTETTGGTSAEK